MKIKHLPKRHSYSLTGNNEDEREFLKENKYIVDTILKKIGNLYGMEDSEKLRKTVFDEGIKLYEEWKSKKDL